MLNVNKRQIARIRKHAKKITREVQDYIDQHTTVAVERATLRMMGVHGVDENGHPLVNALADHLRPNLSRGAALPVAQAALREGSDALTVARRVSKGALDLTDIEITSKKQAMKKARELCAPQFRRIARQSAYRRQKNNNRNRPVRPLIYVIVATGNIYEDVRQALAAAMNGADIVAIIRSTAQSLLDYVPFGPTTEGFGGTYATQENFAIMRGALDDIGATLKRYIMQVNYASGLCMPEIAVMGALERLDMMLNDSMYGILFRDINMYRTFVDQHFSRMLCAFAGIIINTGEDNYLTTADAYEAGHTVLASDFINEQFALRSGLSPSLMGLGHAFEIDPAMENSFLYELAQAMLIRECFPDAPLKYMPPTKYMTGNIFTGYMLNAMFNLAGAWSRQGIQLLGMLTEALHTPHLHDRFLAVENARYIFNAVKNIGDEVTFRPKGIIAKRAREILDQTEKFLRRVQEQGLLKSIERGYFANIRRSRKDGRGQDGVFTKDPEYYNPAEEYLRRRLKLEADDAD